MLKNCLHRSHNGDKLTRKPNSPDKSHLSDLIKISLLSHRLVSISYSVFFCFFVVRRSHFRLFLSTRKENIEMKYGRQAGCCKKQICGSKLLVVFSKFCFELFKANSNAIQLTAHYINTLSRCMYEIIIPKKMNNPRHWSEKGFQLAL